MTPTAKSARFLALLGQRRTDPADRYCGAVHSVRSAAKAAGISYSYARLLAALQQRTTGEHHEDTTDR